MQKAENNISFYMDDFPYREIRDARGDLFETVHLAMKATGLNMDHVWSVADAEGSTCFGPPHHYVNVLGFIATAEPHDHATYYEESYETSDDELKVFQVIWHFDGEPVQVLFFTDWNEIDAANRAYHLVSEAAAEQQDETGRRKEYYVSLLVNATDQTVTDL